MIRGTNGLGASSGSGTAQYPGIVTIAVMGGKERVEDSKGPDSAGRDAQCFER